MSVPLVSLIMPVYNASSRLKNAIECALSQSVDSFEIIAINDGSTDNSADILDSYKKRFPDKIRIITTPNGGAARARNMGLSVASGIWIYFCDSDDEFSPDICEYLIKIAEKNSAQIASCCMKRIFNGKENPRQLSNCRTESDEEVIERNEILNRWLKPLFRIRKTDFDVSHGYLPLCVFRRDIIVENNIEFLPDIRVHEDEAFFLQYLNFVERAALSRKSLYSYIYSDSSASATFFAGKLKRSHVEQNYYLAAKMRLLFWKKFFRSSPVFEFGDITLYISALNHRLMSLVADDSKGLRKKISKFSQILSEEKKTEDWCILLREIHRLSRGKKLFVMAVKSGVLAAYAFCYFQFVLKKN